jgi:PAS domain S-box-containing protein
MDVRTETSDAAAAADETAFSDTDQPNGAQRGWIVALAAAAIGLLLLSSAGLLWVQREATLDQARAQAQREVKRLAAELDQALRQAQAIMADERADTVPPGSSVATALVQALNLPFDLRRLPPGEADAAAHPPGQWLPGLAQQADGRWYLPLHWHQPPEQGGALYELRLAREAVLARFASEGLHADGSMSLFRIEDNGATTILVRHPLVEREQGLTVFGHVATAVARQAAGVIQVTAMIDQVERIVGYQQLSNGGQRLVVVYALPVQQVLAVWRSTLPLAVVLTLLVAAAMGYGAWRLDRSLRALRRSEQHFQTLTDHLPDVVVRYDREGRVLYANPAVSAALGLRPAELVGHSHEEHGVPMPLLETWAACLARVFASGNTELVYFSYPGPAGLRHWEAQVMREPVLVDEVPSVLVVSRDITARREADARRLAAQQLFETVFQAAPEAMSLSEWGTGRLLLVNDAFCQLFDRPREQLVGQSALDLQLWETPTIRQQLLERLQRGERVRDAAASSRRPDGRPIDVRFSAERVQVDGADRLLLMFRDVTQIELDQRALAHSERRFRLAAAHGQVWEWDFGQGQVPASQEFFVLLGHPPPPPDRLGQALMDLIHPDDQERVREALRRCFKGQAELRVECRARDANGQYHWFDTRGSGVRDDTGRVTYMAGTTFDITARKQLEEAQRQTLKHLDTVANVSATLTWTVDARQQRDWLNQAWLAFTGRDLQTECATLWLDDVHPLDRARCDRVFSQAFADREPYSLEYRMRRHDGVYRWLLEQGRPRHDADGVFIGYIGSCLDVTDQRQAEAMALERSAMLEQVFGVLKDMLFVVDAQERFVFFQAGSEDRLYRRPEEFLGRSVAEVMPPALVPPLQSAMATARDHGLQEMDYSMDLPDGTHHFNARLAWLPGAEQCMFLVRDVSEQRAAHRERERLNEFVLLLFSLANRFINLPVQQTDAAINAALGDMGRFVDADRAYLFDYDMVAQTASNTHEWCADGVSPEILNLQNLPFEMIPDWIGHHRLGQVMHVHDTRALPAGNLRDLLLAQGIQSLMALPLMDGQRCMGFVGLDSVRSTHDYGQEETTLLQLFSQMLVNIRLRVEAEEKIQALTEGLEAKVAERTAQLEDSVRQLTTVNRELESFTYSASHDLRTPLRGIEGFSALLLEEHAGQLDAQGREYLQRIQKATLHMAQLISDLLAYSRLQQMTGQIEPIVLERWVHEALAPFQDALAARQGLLQVSIADDLRLRADRQGLAIVLRNLVDNALKFTPADQPPRIRIAAQSQGDRVLLSVSDSGMGFDMKYHDRIFGMFQRLHRQDQIPGTGIGLALVLKAVERMGGHIRAESAPGQGATFHIELPRA